MLLFQFRKTVLAFLAIAIASLIAIPPAQAGGCRMDVRKLTQYRTVTMQVVKDVMTKLTCKSIRPDVFCPLWQRMQVVEIDVLDTMVSCNSSDGQIQQMKSSIIKGDDFARRYCPFINAAL